MSRHRGRRHLRAEESRTGQTTLHRRKRRSSLMTQIVRSKPQMTKRMVAAITAIRVEILHDRPRVPTDHQRARIRAVRIWSTKCSTRTRRCSPMAARSSCRTPTRMERLASRSWLHLTKLTSKCKSYWTRSKKNLRRLSISSTRKMIN